MAARRAFLAGVAAVTAGCVGPSGPADRSGSNGGDSTDAETADHDTDTDSSYHLRAAPAGTSDREPVLSTDDDAVAAIEPLFELIVSVTESSEVEYAALSAADAEAFEELTDGVERYAAGNPPGYYIEHEGTVVSVSLDG